MDHNLIHSKHTNILRVVLIKEPLVCAKSAQIAKRFLVPQLLICRKQVSRTVKDLRFSVYCKLASEPVSFVGADKRHELSGSETKNGLSLMTQQTAEYEHIYISSLSPIFHTIM